MQSKTEDSELYQMKIGVFDSGYGGLTILSEIRRLLPEYDYIYLGDNARAPYGTRSFDVIYRYTLEAVHYLQSQDCHLIILACNTASAKALRTIQQHDIDPTKDRVLGVIRPTVEAVPTLTHNGHIGILATQGTVDSQSYIIELSKFLPLAPNAVYGERGQGKGASISQQPCPMWVPLIENGEKDSPAMDYFVEKYLSELLAKDPDIDTLLLACTHYPLIANKIEKYLKNHTGGQKLCVVTQGELVAHSLADYLHRHADIEARISRGGTCTYLTTESAAKFADSASLFLAEPIQAQHIDL